MKSKDDYAKEIILRVLEYHHGQNGRISSLELIRMVVNELDAPLKQKYPSLSWLIST